MCEDNQITSTSSNFRLCVGPVRAASLRSLLQPQEIHPAATVRLSGVERVPEVGLSQAGGLAGRYARFVSGHQCRRLCPTSPRSRRRPGGCLLTMPARRLLDQTIHVGVAVGRIKRRVALAALDGTGFEIATCQQLLCAAARNRGKVSEENGTRSRTGDFPRPASCATATAT